MFRLFIWNWTLAFYFNLGWVLRPIGTLSIWTDLDNWEIRREIINSSFTRRCLRGRGLHCLSSTSLRVEVLYFHCSTKSGTCPRGTTKGPGKRGHIVADTMLPTQMFPCLPARATFVADTNFVSGTQKMCPQQMFPSLRSPRNIMGNNVSATMCPRLPGP